MSLKVIVGRSGSGKSTKVLNWACREADINPKQRYLILVPDQFTMQTQMDIVKASKGGGVMNIEVLSFSRLAYRVFGETGGHRRPILDDTGKNLILRKCAVDVKDDIPYLAGKLDKPGYIHEVKSAISEFMQYDIDSKELDQLIDYSSSKNRKGLSAKLKDLQIIYDHFKEYISDQFITTEEALDILSQEIYKSDVVRDSIVIMDGFTGFTPIQNRVIGALMEVCKRVIITFSVDADALTKEVKQQDLFSFTHKSYLSVKRLADEHGCLVEEDYLLADTKRFEENEELKFLENNLFKYPVKQFNNECRNIRLTKAMSIKDEVNALSKNIRELVRTNDVCYRDIAVISGNLAAYSSEIREQFEDYNIPTYIDETRKISYNPFVEYIKASLTLFIRDFTSESVMQYLRSGFSDISPEDADILENYIKETGIRGKSSYLKIFTRKTRYMRHNEEQGMLLLSRVEKIRMQMVAELEPFIESNITKNNSHNACEYVKTLYNFVGMNKSADKLSAYAASFAENGDYLKEKEYSQIYKKIMELLEQIHNLIGSEEMPLEEFYGILEAGISEIKVGLIPKTVDKVIVGDLERTRLNNVKYLFFVGLNDGWIPKSTSKGGIISDSDREFIHESGTEIAPSPRMQMYIGRFYLYSNITKPSKALYLSYSALDGESKAMRPSYVVEQIKKMYPDMSVTEADYGKYDNEIMPAETEREARIQLSRLIRKEADNIISDEEKHMLLMLASYTKSDEEYLEAIVDNAFFKHSNARLDEKIAGILYGLNLYSSISRIETYARCAYSYFLRYGMGIDLNEEYGVDNADKGTIYHGVLEIFIELLKERGLDWGTFTDEDARELIDIAVEKEAVLYTDAILFETEEGKYTIERMKSVMLRTVKTLAYQLKKSEFKPAHYEYKFSRSQSLGTMNLGLNAEERLYLTGKIDRLDVCEKDDRILVKIVDYKSGNKDFSLMNFYQGLQLQMVVYMNEAVKEIEKRSPGKDVVPAALLYYHIDDPIIGVSGDESIEYIEAEIKKKLNTKGLVNDSDDILRSLDTSMTEKSDVIPVSRLKSGGFAKNAEVISEDDMRLIMDYANNKILSIAGEMIGGNIDLNPKELYKAGKNPEMDSCQYCDYKSVCGFDNNLPGYEKDKVYAVDNAELLKNMREELGKTEGGAINA